MDLSSPAGVSVIDAIDPDLCSSWYASLENAAHIAQQLGAGVLLAKLDLRTLYRVVPAHADDHALLGIS